MAQRPNRNVWSWFQDLCATTLQPFFGLLTLLSGTTLTFDFAEIGEEHPQWSGLLNLLGGMAHLGVFLVLATASVAVAIVTSRREKTLRALSASLLKHKSQIDEIGNVIIILFDGLLLNLANKLDIKQGAQVRLSLYVHDASNGIFIPCGRYSTNPVFRSPGRTSYPETEGCIGRGWETGWHFDNKVPSGNQAAARRTYNFKTYCVPEWVTDGVKMKSTLYAVKRLDDALGASVAVLVVEAIDADHFDEGPLRAIIESTVADYARVIHEMRGYLPNPAKAAESGL